MDKVEGRLGCLRLSRSLHLVAGVALALWPQIAVGEGGIWREASQLVWDPEARQLVRKPFVVWDPHPDLTLDFKWEAAEGTGGEGIVNGEGRLIWLTRGAPAYDKQAIYSEYEGEVRNGRPDGNGRIRFKSGRSYEGSWRAGVMSGYGKLRFENGDRYEGAFAGGVPDGAGRFAAIDGTIFEGVFHEGVRDGVGTLLSPDGRRFRSVWRQGKEVDRTLITDGILLAQNSGIAVSAYIDTRMNDEFKAADEVFPAYAYSASTTLGQIDVRLESPEIMDLWKGNAVIQEDENGSSGYYFEDIGQFAPVFLVVDLRNDGSFATEVVSSYIEITESSADLQPYVVAWTELRPFSPNFSFRNYGWGAVREAQLTYAFGNEFGPLTPTFVLDLGTFSDHVYGSALDGLAAMGVDVDELAKNEFTFSCSGYDNETVHQCAESVQYSGLLGSLTEASFVRDGSVKTRLTGMLEYNWIDAFGQPNWRTSPVSLDINLADVSQAEMGAPSPIERDFPTVTLPLGLRNVRIPIAYGSLINPGDSQRFALNFVAEKSSHHVFNFAFELADGTTVKSPVLDLLYFLPRFQEIN